MWLLKSALRVINDLHTTLVIHYEIRRNALKSL